MLSIGCQPSDIYIVAGKDYTFSCISQAQEMGIVLDESQIIVEPFPKNTLAAIALAMKQIPKEETVFVTPSDNIILDTEALQKQIETSLLQAKTSLVTFGINPTHPHTGYGYIAFAKSGTEPYKVSEFKEKPNAEKAKEYIQNGYLWNSGSFLFSGEAFWGELQKVNPTYFSVFQKENIAEIYAEVSDLSIDYGLLELSDNIYVTPLNLYWSDLGSFEAIEEYLSTIQAESKNEKITVESEGNFVLSEVPNKTIALIGMDNVIVVDTKDALLIAKKGEGQKIKQVVNQLKTQNKHITEFGQTVYRPWGSYTIIDEGAGFKSKRLSVLCGKRLSAQMHHHRSEHWVVVSGTARVTNGNETFLLNKGESTFIPAGNLHRLENPGKVPLHIIESQIGDYLEEDDIVRFDDDFGR